MKSTFTDTDGNVVCPVCGAKNQFTSKRSGKGKLAAGVLAPKRLKCNGCGTNLKRGGASSGSTLSRLQTAQLLVADGMTYAEIGELRKQGVNLDALVRERGLI